MNTKRIFSFLILILVSLTACTPPDLVATPDATTPPSQEMTRVQLGLGFIPSVQFAPFYVAVEKGYFADENIAIELEHGIETDFLKLLGANERQFIVASGEQVILGRAQALPVTYVATWYHRFPVVVFSQAEAGIETPQDLIDRKVGIPGLFGASYIAWRGLVYAADLPEEQIDLQSIGFTQAAAVDEGLVDAALDYAVNGPVQLRLEDQAVNLIVIDDYIQLPANGLITNAATISGDPELVTGMVRAMLRGIRYTLENPDDAFAISLQYVPEAAQARETNRAIFDASLAFWTPPSGRSLGFTAPEIWADTATFMFDSGLIDKAVDPEEAWTHEFVEAAAVP